MAYSKDQELTPSFHGRDCQYNGDHEEYEIACDECDYALDCFPEFDPYLDPTGPEAEELLADLEAAMQEDVPADWLDQMQQLAQKLIQAKRSTQENA